MVDPAGRSRIMFAGEDRGWIRETRRCMEDLGVNVPLSRRQCGGGAISASMGVYLTSSCSGILCDLLDPSYFVISTLSNIPSTVTSTFRHYHRFGHTRSTCSSRLAANLGIALPFLLSFSPFRFSPRNVSPSTRHSDLSHMQQALAEVISAN